MNWFLLIVLALAPTVADAGPVAAVIGAVGSWVASSAIASAIAWSVASSVLQRALAPKQKAQGPGPISLEAPTAGDATPQTLILGLKATPGNRTAPEYSRAPGLEWLTMVRDVSDVPVNRLVAVWIGNDRIEMPAVMPTGFYEIPGKFANKARVKFYNGTQTVADAFMIAEYGTYPDRPWSSDMILRGVAYAIFECKRDQELFPQMPDLLFEVEGCKLLDPPHWNAGFSRNAALLAYNVFRGITLPDGSVYGGGIAAADLPVQNWSAAINACEISGWNADLIVNVGPEDYDGDLPYAVIENLMAACVGDVAETGGVWRVRVNGPGLPVATISDPDVLVTSNQVFDPHQGPRDIFNGITAQYPEPKERWESKTTPLRIDNAYVARDGRRNVVHVDYHAVTDSQQVQKLAQIALDDNRRQRMHELSVSGKYAALEALDSIRLNLPYDGYQDKLVEVMATYTDPVTMNQRLMVREVDPNDYAPPSVEPLPTVPVVTTPPPPQAVAGWAVEPVEVKDNDGDNRRPGVRIRWDVISADGLEWQLRSVGQTILSAQGTTQAVEDGQLVITDGVITAAQMEIRARFVLRNRSRTWTTWTQFLAPNIGLSGKDLGEQIREEIREEMEEIAAEAGIRPVSTLPLTGRDNEIVMKIPEGILYRWDPVALTWTTQIYAGIQPGSLTATAFANSIKPIEVLGALPGPPHVQGRQVFLTTDNQTYRNTGSGWTLAVPAVNVTGTLTNAQLAAGIDAAKLAGTLSPDRIGTGAILSGKLADNAVTTAKIAANAVDAGKLANSSVTSDKIADAALTVGKFATGIEPVGIITAGSLPAVKSTTVITWQGKLYRWNGTAYVASVPAGDLVGQITSTQITDNSITTAKIAANAVTANEINANAVTADKILANAITTGKIAAGAVTATQMAANSVNAKSLVVSDWGNLVLDPDFVVGLDAWSTIGSMVGVSQGGSPSNMGRDAAMNISGSLTSNTGIFTPLIPCVPGEGFYSSAVIRPSGSAIIATFRVQVTYYDSARVQISSTWTETARSNTAAVIVVKESEAPANAYYVTFAFLRMNSGSENGGLFVNQMTARRKNGGELIVDGAITANKIAANAVTAASIAAGTITATEIAAGAITTAKINALAVTAAEIAAGAIIADKIAANAVTAVKIEAGAVVAGKLAVDAVVANNIAANAITAVKIAANAVEADKIAANAVTADKIAANSITAGKIQAGAVGADQIAANAISAKHLVIGDLSNIVPDGSLMDPTAWTLSGSGSFTLGDTTGWDTPRLMTIDRTAGAVTVSSQLFNVTPNGDYRMAFSGRVVNGTGSIGVQLMVSASPTMSGSTFLEVGRISSTTRTNMAGNVVIPAGMVYAVWRFVVFNDGVTRALLGGAMLQRRNTGALIVDGAITANSIAAGAVTTDALAASAVVATKIAAGAVVADKIGANAVTAVKIEAGAVTTDKLDALAVTAAKIAAQAITADKMSANSITAANGAIANLTVDTLQVAGNAITQTVVNYAVEESEDSTNIISSILNRQGYATRVTFSAVLRVSSSVDTFQPFSVVLYRGTTVIANVPMRTAGLTNINVNFYDTNLGTGPTEYRVGLSGLSVYGSRATNRYIELQQVKR